MVHRHVRARRYSEFILLAAVTPMLASCDGSVFGNRFVKPDAEADVPNIALQKGQQLVASCGASRGYSYYPRIGMVPEEKSGFTEDGISEGYLYLVKQPDDSYDLIFKDATREQRSAVSDGAVVQKLRGGGSDAAFMVHYPQAGRSTEVYTFYREANGKLTFTNLVSKGGDLPIYKSGILAGPCEQLALDL